MKKCIYCFGEYGIALYYQLKEYDVTIDYFVDSAPEKNGYAIDGRNCVSFETLQNKNKAEQIIFVANKNPEELIQKLKKSGFDKVYTYKEVVDWCQKKQRKNRVLPNCKEILEVHSKLLEICEGKKVDTSIGNKELRQILVDTICRHNESC